MKYSVHPVLTDMDEKLFYSLPKKIYENDPHWVPQVKQDVASVFDKKKNRYFKHGKCERWIMFDETKQLAGRIAAFINYKKANTFKQPTGGIGFFECINDREASHALFETAKTWLMDNDMQAMDGPINFGENNKFWGLLIENFSFPTYHGQNYNPPYYVDLFEAYGFKVYYYQIINYRTIAEPLPEKYRKKAEKILADEEFSIETINKNQLAKYAEDFRSVYNEAWGTHDNFKKMEPKLAESLFKKMKPIVDEDLVCFVYHNKKPVAFCLCIPDINPIIKRINGNLNSIGKLRFLFYKYFVGFNRINGVAIGVHPDFQRMGMEGAIFLDLANRFQSQKKYEDIVVTWVGDFNPKMQYIFESIGFYPKSKMATYRKLFNPDIEFERSPIIE